MRKFKSVATHFTSLIPQAVFQENNSRQSICNLLFYICKLIAFEVQLSLKSGEAKDYVQIFFSSLFHPPKTVAPL